MDPENEQPQLEPLEQQETTEQALQSQLATLAAYSAKAIRLGIAAFTGGLSKIGGFLWGIAANWILRGRPFGGLHGAGAAKPGRLDLFFRKNKSGLLLLFLIVGSVLLPFVFIIMDIFATTSGLRTEPLAPLNQ